MTPTSARIRSARLRLGLTLPALAARLRLPADILADWERDVGDISPQQLLDLCAALGVRPEWVVAGEEPVEAMTAQGAALLAAFARADPNRRAHLRRLLVKLAAKTCATPPPQ